MVAAFAAKNPIVSPTCTHCEMHISVRSHKSEFILDFSLSFSLSVGEDRRLSTDAALDIHLWYGYNPEVIRKSEELNIRLMFDRTNLIWYSKIWDRTFFRFSVFSPASTWFVRIRSFFCRSLIDRKTSDGKRSTKSIFFSSHDLVCHDYSQFSSDHLVRLGSH